jgi:hypothetical protein
MGRAWHPLPPTCAPGRIGRTSWVLARRPGMNVAKPLRGPVAGRFQAAPVRRSSRGGLIASPVGDWALRPRNERGRGRAWAMGTGVGFSSGGPGAVTATGTRGQGLRLVING